MNMTLVAEQPANNRLVLILKMLDAKSYQQIVPILSELRYVMLAGIIIGFGRAIGEVGAAMMLGGNIHGSTRTMTIALKTSKGDFELGLALGLLLLIAFTVNLMLQLLKSKTRWSIYQLNSSRISNCLRIWLKMTS
jgi:tungstate transport system permease protein